MDRNRLHPGFWDKLVSWRPGTPPGTRNLQLPAKIANYSVQMQRTTLNSVVSTQNKEKMKRILKIAVKCVLPALLLIIILGLAMLPWGMKKYINGHGKDYLGRNMSVGDIKIRYFKSTLQVTGLKLMEANGTDTFAAFDTLQVTISPWPLLASRLVVRQLRLAGPEVNIVRKDTLFNFDDILAFLDSKPASEPSSEPFTYFLNNISMERGTLTFTDKTVDHTTVMKDLKFFVPSLYFNEEEMKDAGIRFNFENGGSLQAKATYNLSKGSYTADLKVVNLDLAPFYAYVKGYFNINSIGGSAGGDFHVSGNISQPDSMLIRGTGQVTDFLVKDREDRKVLGAGKATVTLQDTYLLKSRYFIDSLRLTGPYVFVSMKDSTINLLNIMVESPEGTAEETVPLYFSIGKLRIEDGVVDLQDNSLEEPFNYNLGSISMAVDSISSESTWLNAFATMKLNNRGSLQAQLGINPSDPYELKIDYVITNFQLRDLNLYSRHYVGFPILLGNMYYKGHTVIAGRQLASQNKLIIRNAALGNRSGGIINLPLKLAVYLLKDIHGDIILDIPLSGDLNDPQTRIGKLIWQTLKNLVVKVVASPFIALSQMMGVDPTEVKGLDFSYADSTLTEKHLKRIRLFTEIEKKKPDMNIALIHINDATLEKQEIALAEAGKLFFAATGEDYKKEADKFGRFIAQKLQSDTISPARGSILLTGEYRLDSIQQSFTKARVRQVEAALKSLDDSTRIKVAVAPKEVPENVGSRPVFELRCNLE